MVLFSRKGLTTNEFREHYDRDRKVGRTVVTVNAKFSTGRGEPKWRCLGNVVKNVEL